jgi:hypothetical protein
MKVAIIGAGIYGCHIASVLSQFGFDVIIYEKNNDIFLEASGNNQFRLHQGYHYARDYKTRNQSKLGFDKFMDLYSEFTREITDNFYIVPKFNSLIDFKTYLAIFSHEGFKFDLINTKDQSSLINVEGIINVSERVIRTNSLKIHFKEKLIDKITFNCFVDDLKLNKLKIENDYVIDCTWGKLNSFADSFFEVTHLAYCRNLTKKSHPALTFVDGNLWSLYPTENSEIFTLSSVIHTPLVKSESLKDIQEVKESLSKDILLDNYIKMTNDVEYYYPTFKDNFEYVGDQVSIKTKIIGANDPRDCRVSIEDNVIRIFSGKIDTLYIAEEFIFNKLL